MQMFGWPQHDFGVLSASADTWSFAPHCRAGQSPICQPSHHHVVRVFADLRLSGGSNGRGARDPRCLLCIEAGVPCSDSEICLTTSRAAVVSPAFVVQRFGVPSRRSAIAALQVSPEFVSSRSFQVFRFKSFVSSLSFHAIRFMRFVSITRKGSSSRQKAAAHSERLIEEFTQVSAHANSTIPRAIFQFHF